MAGPFFRTPAKRNFELVENFSVPSFLLNRSTTVFLRLFQDGWFQKEKIAWYLNNEFSYDMADDMGHMII